MNDEQFRSIRQKTENLKEERDKELKVLKDFEVSEIGDIIEYNMKDSDVIGMDEVNKKIMKNLERLADFSMKKEKEIREKYDKKINDREECFDLLLKLRDEVEDYINGK